MKRLLEKRVEIIKRIAKGDPEYLKIKREFLKAEVDFHEMLPNLTDEQQDLLWLFFNLSNELDQRLLEIACEYVNFNL